MASSPTAPGPIILPRCASYWPWPRLRSKTERAVIPAQRMCARVHVHAAAAACSSSRSSNEAQRHATSRRQCRRPSGSIPHDARRPTGLAQRSSTPPLVLHRQRWRFAGTAFGGTLQTSIELQSHAKARFTRSNHTCQYYLAPRSSPEPWLYQTITATQIPIERAALPAPNRTRVLSLEAFRRRPKCVRQPPAGHHPKPFTIGCIT